MQNDMTMKDAVIAYWTKGFDFSGRARRKEYWLNLFATIIIFFLIFIVVAVIDVLTTYKFHFIDHYHFFVQKIFPYIATIPGMAQASRRLQDINLNGKIAIVILVTSTIISVIVSLTDLFPIQSNMGTGMLLIISLIIILPGLFLFICNFIRGNDGDNKYGPDPKRIAYKNTR